MNFKTLNPCTSRRLDKLVAMLDENGHAKINNNGPKSCFMPLVVEKIGEHTYSLAHYYEQNGDLVSDPEMTFANVNGYWIPLSFTMGGLGIHRDAVHLDDAGNIKSYHPNELADEVSFATIWIRNIWQQQGL